MHMYRPMKKPKLRISVARFIRNYSEALSEAKKPMRAHGTREGTMLYPDNAHLHRLAPVFAESGADGDPLDFLYVQRDCKPLMRRYGSHLLICFGRTDTMKQEAIMRSRSYRYSHPGIQTMQARDLPMPV